MLTFSCPTVKGNLIFAYPIDSLHEKENKFLDSLNPRRI